MKNCFYFFLIIAFLGGVTIAGAQQPGKIYRIGILSGGFSGASPDIEAFRQGLRDLGYVEGQNIIIEWRYAEGKRDRYPDLVSDLIRLKVDLIIANGTEPTTAAKKATSTIPIVMTSSTDPERTGLIASLGQPGGNVTGVTEISGELAGKLLELLKEVVPKLTRVAIVFTGQQTQQTGELAAASKLYVKEIRGSGTRANSTDYILGGPGTRRLRGCSSSCDQRTG
jgi:putative tryptophan/tyrosine transport system substrate-binding protein